MPYRKQGTMLDRLLGALPAELWIAAAVVLVAITAFVVVASIKT